MFNVSSRCQKLHTSSGILVSPVVSKNLLLRYSLHLLVDSIVVTPEHFVMVRQGGVEALCNLMIKSQCFSGPVSSDL